MEITKANNLQKTLNITSVHPFFMDA